MKIRHLFFFFLHLSSAWGQDACLDGWVDASDLSLGCLYYHPEVPTSQCHAKFLCDELGTGLDTSGGTGDAVVQVVEVADLAGANSFASIFQYSDFKDKTIWLGASYVKAVTDFTWNSDTSAAWAAAFADIFTPDDNDPAPTFDGELCVSMVLDGGFLKASPKWDDVSCWESSYNLVCQCTDKCPAVPTTAEPTTVDPTAPVDYDCIGDWTAISNVGCVQVVPDAAGLPYDEAEQVCKDMGGNLVEIETSTALDELKKAQAIWEIVWKDQSYWLGMQEIFNNVWVNPASSDQITDVSFFDWYDGASGGTAQPDETATPSPDSPICVVSVLGSTQKGWHDVECGVTSYLGKDIMPICMQDPDQTATTDPDNTDDPTDPTANPTDPTADPTGPTVDPTDPTATDNPDTTVEVVFPPECLYYNGDLSTCYLHQDTPAKWTEAEDYCAGLGGHMVSVHSAAENDFIRFFVIGNSNFPIWIGGKGTGSNGAFTWTDESDFDYDNWRTEPGNGNTDCIYLSRATGEWSTYDCDYAIRYACKLVKDF